MHSRMTKVAVIGLNGEIGKPLLRAITSPLFREHYQFPIHAITRNKSKAIDSPEVKHFEATLDDERALRSALEGVDVLVSLVGFGLEDKTQTLIRAAADAGVKVYFPSDFDTDDSQVDPWPFPNAFTASRSERDFAKSLGLRVVEIKTGIVVDWFLNNPILFWNNESMVYKKVGDGEQKIALSCNQDIANVIASLAHRDPKDLPDVMQMQSEALSINKIVDIFERAKGTTLKVEGVSAEQVVKRAKELDASGESATSFENFVEVFQAIVALGYGDHSKGNRDVANPGLWNWSKFEPIASEKWSAQ